MLETDKLIVSDLIAMASNVASNLEKENTELRNAMITFRNFLDSNSGTSETIKAMKQIAEDYARDISLCISANECDIKDCSTLQSSIGTEDFDGSVIIPAMNSAKSSYDFHSGEYSRISGLICSLNSSQTAEIENLKSQRSYHEQARNSYNSEYHAWLNKANTFDAINSSVSKLFTFSETYRNIAREGLTALDGSITVDCIVPTYSMDWLKDVDCANSKEMVHSGILPQSFFLNTDEREKLRDLGYTDKDIMSLQSRCISSADREFVRNLIKEDYTAAFSMDETSDYQGIKENMSVYAFRHLKMDGAGNYTEDSIKNLAKMNDDLLESNWNQDYILNLTGSRHDSKKVITVDGLPLSNVSESMFNSLEIKAHRNLTSSSDPTIRVSKPFSKLSFEERELYVILFEEDSDNKTYASNMNSVREAFEKKGFADWEKHLSNIKFMAYSADEPYRSTYLKNVQNVKYDLSYTDWPNTTGNTIHIDASQFNLSDPSYYGTFFHESTHAIDSKLGDLSSNHKYNDKNLTDALEADVRSRVEDTIQFYLSQGEYKYLSDADKLRLRDVVMDSIMNQVDYDTFGNPNFTYILGGDSLSDTAKKFYIDVKDSINTNMTSMASDAYGAFTGNTIGGVNVAGGHAALDGPNGPGAADDFRIYWLNNGKINGADGTGLWIKTEDGKKHKIDPKIVKDIRDISQTQSDKCVFDEKVIMSKGDVTYQNGKAAAEVFAEDMAAHLTGDKDEINGLQFFNQDTRDFLNDMYKEASK